MSPFPPSFLPSFLPSFRPDPPLPSLSLSLCVFPSFYPYPYPYPYPYRYPYPVPIFIPTKCLPRFLSPLFPLRAFIVAAHGKKPKAAPQNSVASNSGRALATVGTASVEERQKNPQPSLA